MTRLKARRGSYAGTDATRTAILDAAVTVFGNHGYRGGSLQRIGELANLSTPGLLHHFPDKASLLRAALDHADPWISTSKQEPSDLSDLIELCIATATHTRTVTFFASITAEATSPEHPGQAQLLAGRTRRTDWLERQIRRLSPQGTGLGPRSLAEVALALLDGMQLHEITVTEARLEGQNDLARDALWLLLDRPDI